jgi:putative Ca2+/H+ antiporter (TMEM165/GDT1 family)
VDPYLVFITFPVIFVGELPDRTMFASVVMATRGRPGQVWLGAAAAFAAHVAIAVTLGVALFAVLPKHVLDGLLAAMFLLAAIYAWRESTKTDDQVTKPKTSKHGAVLTALIVIFLAEWGDLTQILTANLAAKYHAALPVAIGPVLALWAVVGIAVASGQTLLRFVNIVTIRKATAIVLLILATYSAGVALR